MGGSSGEDVDYRIVYVECDGLIDEGEDTERACEHASLMDVWIDPVTNMCGWKCPACHKDHTKDIEGEL